MSRIVIKLLAIYLTKKLFLDDNHLFDTQLNEVLNYKITFFTPTNRLFSGANSLSRRIYLAFGVDSIILNSFVKCLFNKMGPPGEKGVSS